MHRIFGEKENVDYMERKGAYLVPIERENIAVVRTPKGWFLLGGGSEPGETEEETILRECREETGCTARIGRRVCTAEAFLLHPELGYFHPVQTYYLGEIFKQEQVPLEKDHQLEWIAYEELQGNLFVEMQNWALEKCWEAFQKRN